MYITSDWPQHQEDTKNSEQCYICTDAFWSGSKSQEAERAESVSLHCELSLETLLPLWVEGLSITEQRAAYRHSAGRGKMRWKSVWLQMLQSQRSPPPCAFDPVFRSVACSTLFSAVQALVRVLRSRRRWGSRGSNKVMAASEIAPYSLYSALLWPQSYGP